MIILQLKEIKEELEFEASRFAENNVEPVLEVLMPYVEKAQEQLLIKFDEGKSMYERLKAKAQVQYKELQNRLQGSKIFP